jgi:YegS/Rv2252/BmrU family lipid kinase
MDGQQVEGERAHGALEERTVLLVNVHARTGERRFAATCEALAEAGVQVHHAEQVRRPSQLPELVRSAVAAGARRVLVGGGDGTLSAAARVLVGTDAALGVIPLGTGNDFARSIGLPLDVVGAARVVREGVVRAVDVGLADRHAFLNAASVGLTVAVARRLTSRLKRWAGKLAYPVAAAQEALDFQPLALRVTVDGEEHRLNALQLVVGNGRFHGAGNLIAPGASLEDARLHVYAILARLPADGPLGSGEEETGARLQDLATLAHISLKLRRGTHEEHPDVLALSGRVVEVASDDGRVHRINVDGEMLGQTPARFRVAPRALRVLVPAGGEDGPELPH